MIALPNFSIRLLIYCRCSYQVTISITSSPKETNILTGNEKQSKKDSFPLQEGSSASPPTSTNILTTITNLSGYKGDYNLYTLMHSNCKTTYKLYIVYKIAHNLFPRRNKMLKTENNILLFLPRNLDHLPLIRLLP